MKATGRYAGCLQASTLVDGVSDAGVSEMARHFLLSRAAECSTIPAHTFSVHREQMLHFTSDKSDICPGGYRRCA